MAEITLSERKSNMIKKMFLSVPQKGSSEKDFLFLLRNRIDTVMSFSNVFFNDVNIENKNMFAYYSSEIPNDSEKEYFYKTFNDISLLNKFQFNQNHFSDFVINVAKGLDSNNPSVYKKALPLIQSIIEVEWCRDIDTLLLDKYVGNNIFTHFISKGIGSSMGFLLHFENKKISKKMMSSQKYERLTKVTGNDKFLDNFLFDSLLFSFEKEPHRYQDIFTTNDELISSIYVGNIKDYKDVARKAIHEYEEIRYKDFIKNEFGDNEKLEKTIKRIRI